MIRGVYSQKVGAVSGKVRETGLRIDDSNGNGMSVFSLIDHFNMRM